MLLLTFSDPLAHLVLEKFNIISLLLKILATQLQYIIMEFSHLFYFFQKQEMTTQLHFTIILYVIKTLEPSLFSSFHLIFFLPNKKCRSFLDCEEPCKWYLSITLSLHSRC